MWDRNYETARRFWRARCFLELAKEFDSPLAVEAALCAPVPGIALSRLMNALAETSANVGLCKAVDRVVPCDCLRDVLTEHQGAAPSSGRPDVASYEKPNPKLNLGGVVYPNLPVREHLNIDTGGPPPRHSSRGHVEVRSIPPPLNDDGGKFFAIFCAPASRDLYTSMMIHPEQAASTGGGGGKDDWATFLITKMQQELYYVGFRPRLITARDPVLVRALRRAGGMQCPGTNVEVVGPDEVVDGAPLVGIMDGLFSDLFLQSLQAVTGRQEFDPSVSADSVVRASTSRPGEFKLDKKREDRTIPEMTWACGGCNKLLRREIGVDSGGGGGRDGGRGGGALKRCSGCNAVRYCGRQCQIDDWRARHKGECEALRKKSSV